MRFLDWVSGDRDKEVEMWVICLALPLEQQAEISVVSPLNLVVQIAKIDLFKWQNVIRLALPLEWQAQISVVSPQTFHFISSDHIGLDTV